jgi:DNA-binding CsgD family transcriptional regulator
VKFDDETRIFETVLDVVDEVAAGRLVVWLVDDIQWADPASWRFLHYSSRRAPSMRLLVLATFRDDESVPDDPAWTRLVMPGSREGTERLGLERLSPSDTERLVRELCGSSVADTDLRAVVERSEGTPLLVEELVAMSGTVGTRRGTVPDVVRITARERARKAGSNSRALLDLAAVMGHDADLDLLVDLRPDQAMAVDSLVDAGLLTNAGGGRTVEFRHPLLREAVYAEIPWERRRRLHAEAASALMNHSSPQSVERVARHWELAGRPDEALASLLEVVEATRRQRNLLRTTTLGLLAVALIDRHERLHPQREGVVEPLLGELFQASRWDDLAPLLYTALESAPVRTPHRVRLAAMRGQTDFLLGVPLPQVLRTIEAELAHISNDASPEAAVMLVNASLLYAAAGDMPNARQLAERSVLGAAKCGELDIELRARLQRLWADVAFDRNRTWTAEQVRIAGERARNAGLHQREASAALIMARITQRYEDIEHAMRVTRTSSTWLEAGARIALAYRLAFDGRLAEARAALDSVDLDDEGSHMAWGISAGRIIVALCEGDTATARGHVAKFLGSAFTAAPQYAADAAAMNGWLKWVEGDLPAAVESLAQCLDAMKWTRLEPGLSGPYLIALHVDALLRLGAADEATSVYATQAAIEDRPDADPYTLVSFAAARLRLEPSPDHLSAALLASETHGWPWMGALAASWGAKLLDDADAARRALEMWTAIGYVPGMAEMKQFLAASDVRPLPGVAASLTRREHTVADLIAEGLTNAQIGERLGISAVTVAHHVSSVLDKLGVASRTQVAVLRARRSD